MHVFAPYRPKESRDKRKSQLSQIYDIASIFPRFCAHVRQLKKFSMDTKFGNFIVHWSTATLKFLTENLTTNFGLIAVFVKVALESTKKAQHCVLLINMFSCFFFKSRIAGCRVYKGHLQHEWVIKTCRKRPKSSKFVYIKSSHQFMHNLYLFVEIQRYLEISVIDFCETLHTRRQAPKVYVTWSIS